MQLLDYEGARFIFPVKYMLAYERDVMVLLVFLCNDH